VLAGDATDATVAQIIQAGARQAGLNVQIRSMQPLAFDNASVEASARAGLSLLLALSYNGAPNPLEQMQFDENPISVYNYDGFKSPTVLNNLAAAFRSTNPIARAKFEITAQQAYEQGLSSESLLQLDEVLFLNKHLCGATASFAYLDNASLAAIGACG
jgi:peptide/nickel transport system substrate-binding protein